MKILLVHNFYQQPGGEDEVFRSEGNLLRARGHDVGEFVVHNDQVEGMGRLKLLGATVWNRTLSRELRDRVRREKVEVAHFHNAFPLVSPAAYRAAKAGGAAVVQTLHNYRLLCPGATFFRDGRVCEDCLGKAVPWPGAVHRCYRGNVGASVATVGMLTAHRAAGTYARQVDRYVALSEFARGKFIAGGLPAGRVVVKPNFLDADPGIGAGGSYALFVGRLTEEKGVRLLLEAWRENPPLPLKIVGDGPLRGEVEAAVAPSIQYVGRQPSAEVLRLMGAAACVVFPSLWYEGMPRTIIESFAVGTPVVACDLGTMRSMVIDGVNGAKVPAGDAAALRGAVGRLAASQGKESLRASTRADFESKYTASNNYELLMRIYAEVAWAGRPCHVNPPGFAPPPALYPAGHRRG